MKIKNDLENKEVAKVIRSLINKGYFSEITYSPEEDFDFIDSKTEDEVLQDLEVVRYMDIPERSNFWVNYQDDKISLQEDFDEKNELTEDHKEYFLRNKFEGFDTYSEILEIYEDLIQKKLEKQGRE